MATKYLLDLYFTFRFLLVFGKASFETRVNCFLCRRIGFFGYLLVYARRKSRVWCSDLYRKLYVAYDFA